MAECQEDPREVRSTSGRKWSIWNEKCLDYSYYWAFKSQISSFYRHSVTCFLILIATVVGVFCLLEGLDTKHIVKTLWLISPLLGACLQGSVKDGKTYTCIICTEPFCTSRPGEVWIQCGSCLMWCHEECAEIGTLAVFTCDFCKWSLIWLPLKDSSSHAICFEKYSK